jgi:hypothetical protein
MVAVASSLKGTGDRITKLSAEQLKIIAQASRLGLEGVQARWMRATYRSYELEEMNVLELIGLVNATFAFATAGALFLRNGHDQIP